ncbi:MAG: disulfide bond formation protein [Pelagibacteraceae bacterium BACL5 MAG-120705-bin12]|jgi:disulfide bond formation protein DsbB|nr:MAG: disulfide bond formation protein [Pelagibacteraceae bacterium BACL5 MAG-121015-bin10]KRO60619.1 MAG: disulfide bond formation protein [Pelagibacteraceae bacterium BACL5 MAG-120705-bin12]KRO65012.1 MAG: disulfide bond formation protein [Pelagibacteraceae bacterium BACL5 MAG-120820-bin39]MDA1166663.1 disulfide bond formation protein B [Pseudomonadota bacterium]
MDKLNKNNTLLLVFFISIIALISAYFIEYILGHQPCNLCLIERIPYALSIIIIFLIYKFKQFEKILIMLLILVFVFSFIVSIYHFGIEQGYIKESLVCDLQNGSKILSKDELLKELQKKTVSCKDVTFKLFGLSLTTFNIFISLLITGILAKNFLNYEKNK